MSTISETGHAKNVANWHQLNSIVTGYGAVYNPSRSALQIPGLQELGTNAQNVINAVNVAYSNDKQAMAAREVAFDLLSPTVTSAVNALKATGTTTQVDDIAKTIARKIKGERAVSKKAKIEKALAADEKEIKVISSSQMSYDNRLANLDELISLFESIPEYIPNEEKIKTTTLRNFHADLCDKNSTAVCTAVALSNARIARNKVLYSPLTGLVDLSVDVKNYVKSVFGATSPQYKQISKIIFKNITI
jgi:flavodoxin